MSKIEELEKQLYLLKHTKQCQKCKKEFISKRTDGKYCSSKCCKLAWKNRRSPEQIKKDNELAKNRMRKLREERKNNGFK